MIDHISVRVQDLSRALDFYKGALAPLGYQVLMQFPGVAGLGAGGKPDLWIMETDQPVNPTHVAFNGARDQIDAFHEAAMAAGGTDNGPPGLRADYHPHYYAAFVLDGDGNNVEVVCHDPEGASEAQAAPKARRAPVRKPVEKAAKKAVKTAASKPADKAATRAKATKGKATKGKATKGKAMTKAGKPAKKRR